VRQYSRKYKLGLEWVKNFSITNSSNDFIFTCHLLFAAFFFSNFFLFGQILIASTDVLNLNFPMLIFAKRNFLSGDFGLWNPYIMGGVSSSSYALSPILSPDNWLHFIFPEKYFFVAGTFLAFIKLWLIGVFAYLLFCEEMGNKKWAFFASTIYQLSGYTIWAVMVYDVLSMLLFTTISLYLIWTLDKRSTFLNYIYLSVMLTANLFSSNISYGAYSLILLLICFIYCYLTKVSKVKTVKYRIRYLLPFPLSFLTSILLAAVRLIPVWIAAHNSTRSFTFNPDFLDRSFLILRLFNPEIFGICYRTSSEIFQRISELYSGMHIQWAMPQFFGILPALLTFWAIVSSYKGRVNFWTFYVIITLALIVFIEPFDTIFRAVNPVYHTLSMQIFLPIGFCMLAGYTAINMEQYSKDFSLNDKPFKMFLFLLVTVTLYNFVIWIAANREKIELVRLFMIIGSIVVLLLFLAYWRWQNKITTILPTLHILTLAGLTFFMLIADSHNKTFLSHLKTILASLVMLISSFIMFWIMVYNKVRLKSHYLRFSILVLFICSFVVLYPWTEAIRDLPNPKQYLTLAGLGFTKFVVISFIFIAILIFLDRKRLDPSWLFSFFILILLFDQLPAGKIHSHIVINPFYKASTPYPPSPSFSRENNPSIEIDTKNYRVNNPNSMLQIPLYKELYGDSEILSSIYSVYGIRSYGGYYNLVSKRYEKFIRALAPNAPSGTIGAGVYTYIKDERFLDLMGVGYDYDNNSGVIRVRPNALSRLMLFKSFEVIRDDDKALGRLKDPEFNPLKTVILNIHPSISSTESQQLATELKSFKETTSSVEVFVKSKSPAVLLFNDSYHEGWKVFVNGKEQSILIADFNFMAAVIPAGENKVIFRFQPQDIYIGLKFASIGALMFFLTGIIFFGTRNHLDDFLCKDSDKRISFKIKILSHIRAFKFSYFILAFLCILAVAQGVLSYRFDYKRIMSSTAAVIASSHQPYPDQGPENLLIGIGVWHAVSPPEYPQWIQVKYKEPVKITTLGICAQLSSPQGSEYKRSPRDFIFQGSYDGKTWDELLKVENAMYKYGGEWKKWSFKNKNYYTYYRIYITANNGDSQFLTIKQINLE
jgi:hypothetical protein